MKKNKYDTLIETGEIKGLGEITQGSFTDIYLINGNIVKALNEESMDLVYEIFNEVENYKVFGDYNRFPKYISHGEYYIELEYIRGKTLYEFLNGKDNKITPFWKEQLWETFEYVKSKGYAISDLNEDNIIINQQGDIIFLDLAEYIKIEPGYDVFIDIAKKSIELTIKKIEDKLFKSEE